MSFFNRRMKKSKWLQISAGKTAADHIRKYGFNAEDFGIIPAAAGGPKWIALYGLDQYLFKDFFTKTHTGLDLIGASAGGWRMMCAMLDDSSAAFERFLESYTNQRYDTWPTQVEVKDVINQILEYVLGDDGVDQILNHPVHRLHIITSKGNFPLQSNRALKRKLFGTFVKNLISRGFAGSDFDRYIFSNKMASLKLLDDQGYRTFYQELTKNNTITALRATGSIPVLMTPENAIVGADGSHWDGGIVDYHPALQYNSDKLILYPHFYPYLKKGWFDKYLFWRKASKKDVDRTVIISPTKAFINELPNQKLPDRKDFEHYMGAHDDRVKAWYTVAEKSKILGDEMNEIVTKGLFLDFMSE